MFKLLKYQNDVLGQMIKIERERIINDGNNNIIPNILNLYGERGMGKNIIILSLIEKNDKIKKIPKFRRVSDNIILVEKELQSNKKYNNNIIITKYSIDIWKDQLDNYFPDIKYLTIKNISNLKKLTNNDIKKYEIIIIRDSSSTTNIKKERGKYKLVNLFFDYYKYENCKRIIIDNYVEIDIDKNNAEVIWKLSINKISKYGIGYTKEDIMKFINIGEIKNNYHIIPIDKKNIKKYQKVLLQFLAENSIHIFSQFISKDVKNYKELEQLYFNKECYTELSVINRESHKEKNDKNNKSLLRIKNNINDNMCNICYEELLNNKEINIESIIIMKCCGNIICNRCYIRSCKILDRHCKSKYKAICPYCRKETSLINDIISIKKSDLKNFYNESDEYFQNIDEFQLKTGQRNSFLSNINSKIIIDVIKKLNNLKLNKHTKLNKQKLDKINKKNSRPTINSQIDSPIKEYDNIKLGILLSFRKSLNIIKNLLDKHKYKYYIINNNNKKVDTNFDIYLININNNLLGKEYDFMTDIILYDNITDPILNRDIYGTFHKLQKNNTYFHTLQFIDMYL